MLATLLAGFFLLEPLGVPVSVLANSAMYDYAPELMAAFRARGDEVVGHGRTNAERQSVLDEAAELLDRLEKAL